jgi:hypothetical protein
MTKTASARKGLAVFSWGLQETFQQNNSAKHSIFYEL